MASTRTKGTRGGGTASSPVPQIREWQKQGWKGEAGKFKGRKPNQSKPPCILPNCDRRHLAKGFCREHYYRNRRYGNPYYLQHKIEIKGECLIEDCTRVEYSLGWCYRHYRTYLRNGDPTFLKKKPNGFWDGKECDAPDCDRDVESNGYCAGHARRLRTHGTLIDQRSNAGGVAIKGD